MSLKWALSACEADTQNTTRFTSSPMKSLCLMIVDDNLDLRRVMRRMISSIATKIVECEDDNEALAAYSRTPPDWVLMDIGMNGMDGITAAYPDARVIIVTNHNHDQYRQVTSDCGACSYVLKENLLD